MISEMSRNSSFIETALDRNTNINMITAMDLTAAKAIGGGGGGGAKRYLLTNLAFISVGVQIQSIF